MHIQEQTEADSEDQYPREQRAEQLWSLLASSLVV